MDLTDDLLDRVSNLLKRFTMRDHVCKELDTFTLKVNIGEVSRMTRSHVYVRGEIVDDHLRYMRRTFAGRNLVECQCGEQKQKEAIFKFSDAQWHACVEDNKEVIIVSAKKCQDVIDATSHKSAVIPVKNAKDNNDFVSCLELFSGGFGGWAQALKILSLHDYPIATNYAVDRDHSCCIAFKTTHEMDYIASDEKDAWDFIQFKERSCLMPNLVFQADIQSRWWLTFVTRTILQMICMSAPCPPWSAAGNAPGLTRADGWTFIEAIITIALVRPRTFASENVSHIVKHSHWRILKEVVLWANYDIIWNHNADLVEVLPQHRERNLLVAIDLFDRELFSHKPMPWPKSPVVSLKHSNIVMTLDEFWSERATISEEEFSAYMDSKFMPGEHDGHLRKRSKRDVMRYRLRTDQDVMSCILTTYGKPFSIDNQALLKKGIFGALLREGSSVRKLVTPELAMLMGIQEKTWLPNDESTAVTMLGNAISVEHAMIAVLNCLKSFRSEWFDSEDIQHKFARLMKDKINSSNIVITHEDEGLWIDKGSSSTIPVSVTQPQKQISNQFRVKGFRTFFSAPVISKKITSDGRPSLRGDASGTAIISSIPCQSFKGEIPVSLWQSARISCSIMRLKNFDILLVAVYGLPNGACSQVKRANDLLLACVHQVVAQLRIPFLIAGDFNCDISSLPAFRLFKDIGAEEAFSFYERTHQTSIGYTCRGATKNDTCIFHPALLPLIVDMWIPDFQDFYPHTPLMFKIKGQQMIDIPMKFDVPQSWSSYDVNMSDIASHYPTFAANMQHHIDEITCANSGEIALSKWSHAVECAVDRALKQKHEDDPIRHPCKGLPGSCRGRCKPRKLQASCPEKALPNDKHGGYNPDVEVITDINKFKVRQTRRLQSLCNAVKAWIRDHSTSYSHQIQKEWECILRAPGYGKGWSHWICRFEGAPPVPHMCPSLEDLYSLQQLTRFDCDASCRQEASQKKKAFKLFMQIDNEEDFGRMTYKLMKDVKTNPINEIQNTISVSATLLRSTKGTTSLRIDHVADFHKGFPATFGDCQILITDVQDCKVSFNVVKGVIPSTGTLCQHQAVTSPKDIGDKFNDHWAKYWQRDTFEEQFSHTAWLDFEKLLEDVNFPQIQCNVHLQDVDVWIQIIRSLPKNKAAGPCGWVYEEIQKLPRMAIEHLVQIFLKIWPYGMSDEMMKARAILLAKIENPSRIEHTRPTTILSCLYRLASKIVYTQVASVWAKNLPCSVSGGLPNRGVRDLSLQQCRIVENAIKTKQKISGTSMDLVKAFNLIPRWPIYLLLNRLGIDRSILDFWLFSITKLKRYPSFRGQILEPVASCTGLPEGDSWSVLGMISLSSLFWYRVANPKLQPFCYADNWSWIAKDVRSQFIAWKETLNLISTCRMQISIDKSWVWALDKNHRNALLDLNHLFPDGLSKLQAVDHVRDLGEIIQYDRRWFSQPILERITTMCQRIRGVGQMPISFDFKARRIQTGAYPFGLYAADSHYIGSKHFDSIRRAVFVALVGQQANASPLLACTLLSSSIMDPLVHTVVSAFRTLRRLAARNEQEAKEMLLDAIAFSGSVPYGPASSLAMYCKQLGLTLVDNGEVTVCNQVLFYGLTSSPKEIKKALMMHWVTTLPQMVSRKGIGNPIDIKITWKALDKLDPADRKLITLNVTGGYQSEGTKQKWINGHENTCPLCQQVDSHWHRAIECPALATVRQKHSDAVGIIVNQRPEWVYHVIAREHESMNNMALLLRNIVDQPVNDLVGPNASSHIYFTDGSCLAADIPKLARSTWAVVRQCNINSHPVSLSDHGDDMITHLGFRCALMGFTAGKQSIERAELTAVIKACQHALLDATCKQVCIVTDSQYVIDIFSLIQVPGWKEQAYRSANFDLLHIFSQLISCLSIELIKVKSHRQLHDATSADDLRMIIGNDIADKAAALAMTKFPHQVQEDIRLLKLFCDNELQFMNLAFAYFLDLNKLRVELLSQTSCTAFTRAQVDTCLITRAMGDDALQLFIAFQINHPKPPIMNNPTDEVFCANPLGAQLGKAVFLWACSLQWPHEDIGESCDHDNGIVCGWGISLLELLFNFFITTGFYFPIRISGSAGNSVFLPYHSDEALLISPSKRSVGNQIQSLLGCLASLSSILGFSLFPIYRKKGATSLHRLNFATHIHGISRRPVMVRAQETLHQVLLYIQSLGNARSAFAPVTVLDCQPSIDVPWTMDEPSVLQRSRNYSKLMMRKKRQADAA